MVVVVSLQSVILWENVEQYFKLKYQSWLRFHCNQWNCGKMKTNVADAVAIAVVIPQEPWLCVCNCGCRHFSKTLTGHNAPLILNSYHALTELSAQVPLQQVHHPSAPSPSSLCTKITPLEQDPGVISYLGSKHHIRDFEQHIISSFDTPAPFAWYPPLMKAPNPELLLKRKTKYFKTRSTKTVYQLVGIISIWCLFFFYSSRYYLTNYIQPCFVRYEFTQ